MRKKLYLLALCVCLLGSTVSINAFAQLKTISEARALGAGATVTIKGLVMNASELGKIRYITDGTACVPLFDSGTQLQNVTLNDSLQVTGTLVDYFGLLEMNPLTSVIKLNSNNAEAQPTDLPPADAFAEANEACLVRISNVKFTDPGFFATNNTNYSVTDGDGNYYQVRITATTNIAGTPIPTEYINITGLMSEYSTTYQLLPRTLSDFDFLGNPPIFSSIPYQTDITTTSFKVNFKTLENGNTAVKYGLTPDLELGTVSLPDLVQDHAITLNNLQAGNIYYVQAYSVSSSNDTSKAGIQRMATQSLSTGNIKVYFNRSVDNSVSDGVDAISLGQHFDDTLKAYIHRAKHSIDISIYSIDFSNGILDSLKAANQRGVITRYIFDSGVEQNAIDFLPGNFKSQRPTALNGIMHNKFIIIDALSSDPNDDIVITGSTNFTDNQLKKDANNLIIFQDQTLAKAYTIEFEEMLNGKFSYEKEDNTPKEFVIGGKRVELYFSPTDFVNPTIKRCIGSANNDLSFALLSFTRTDIAYAIENAENAGVQARGIMDSNANTDEEVVYNILIDDMPNTLLIDKNDYIFHHKYLIADESNPNSDPLILTGSHNWSTSAQSRNDENTVVVHDATIANLYFQEFNQRFKDIATGVSNYTNNVPPNQILVYPNPSTGSIILQNNTLLQTANQPQITATIFDIHGKTVTSQTLQNQAKNTININYLDAGIYILKINNEIHKITLLK